ncbi:MAG: lysylphosphatidylglycerol synthase transmembrane domain-containing protein [Myxococcota bacterium]
MAPISLTVTRPDLKSVLSARRTGLWMVIITILVLFSLIGALQTLPLTHGVTDDILERLNWAWLALSCVAMSMAFICMAARWRALMPETVHPPLHELTGLICAGLLLNYAAPGPVGEFGAAWFAHKRYPITLETSLASGISARLLGLMTTAILGVIIWLAFDLPIAESHQGLIQSSAILIGCGGLLIGVLAAFPKQWQRFLLETLRFIPHQGLKIRLERAINRVTDAVSQVLNQHPMRYVRAVIWSTGAHASVILGIVLAAVALNAPFSLAGLAFTYTMTTAAAVLLFAFPGSYLGWDALFLGLLITTAGMGTAEATAIALIVRLQQIVYMGLGGFSLRWLVKGIEKQPKSPEMG